jgi:hypothetical protein
MSMKNFTDTIGNQSLDLPVCSAVPQPLRHCVPHITIIIIVIIIIINTWKNYFTDVNGYADD